MVNYNKIIERERNRIKKQTAIRLKKSRIAMAKLDKEIMKKKAKKQVIESLSPQERQLLEVGLKRRIKEKHELRKKQKIIAQKSGVALKTIGRGTLAFLDRVGRTAEAFAEDDTPKRRPPTKKKTTRKKTTKKKVVRRRR